MSEWFETLGGLHEKAWQHLGRGVADRHHPARHPTFSTVSPAGWPEARTVVLRAADSEAAVLEVHTDLFSDKVASLKKSPRAAFHVWIEKARLQIRAQVEVSVLSGDPVAAVWARVPDPSRQSYGVSPPPGSPISGALDYKKTSDPATFAVLRCEIASFDLLHLGQVHRRARFTRARDWTGEWLVP